MFVLTIPVKLLMSISKTSCRFDCWMEFTTDDLLCHRLQAAVLYNRVSTQRWGSGLLQEYKTILQKIIALGTQSITHP